MSQRALLSLPSWCFCLSSIWTYWRYKVCGLGWDHKHVHVVGCAHSPVISPGEAATIFTGCIYTFCHPFVFALRRHFCFFEHLFCSSWQAAPHLSKTCEKWLAPLICEGRLHFLLVTKGVLDRTKSESLSYITFSSHTILFTGSASLVWSVTESAVEGGLTLCLAWGVLHPRCTFFINTGFMKSLFSGNTSNKVISGKKKRTRNERFHSGSVI